MKKFVSTLILAGLVMVLTATPIAQRFLHSTGLGVAYAQDNQGDDDDQGEDEP